MDLYRFHVADLAEQLPRSGGVVTLAEEESHHARAVLRLEAGEQIALFDGRGLSVNARVEQVGKRALQAKALASPTFEEHAALQLTLATAVPKGDRAEWLIEQASQLNAAAVQWLDCRHSVVKPREGGQKMEKWRRYAIEAAKQCGRAYIMDVHEAMSAEAMILAMTDTPRTGPAKCLWLEPGAGGVSVGEALRDFAAGQVTALIGPEGGWSADEIGLLERAVRDGRMTRVRLSSNVLRIETACAAVAALVMGR